MIIKFKKLHREAVLPTKGSEGAAAYDLCSIEIGWC
jgi:dUTPase